MSDSKKRKALDQLSPYSQNNEEISKSPETVQSQPTNRIRKRAKANIGKPKGLVSDTSSLKGILPSFTILSQSDVEDKLSGLNRCFLSAITKIVNKQSDKDLRYIFKQYEMYMEKIDKKNGWGHNIKHKLKDAIADSHCKNMKKLSKKYLSYLIHASGQYVGLQKGSMGNSEVGHLTLGAGRIVKQNIILIDEGFEDGSIKLKLGKLLMLKRTRLHLVGLVSDGGIHSHIRHLKELIKLLHTEYDEIFVHCISDGRDTAPHVFMQFYEDLNISCSEIKNFQISSVGGRFYAMDRDDNKDRIDRYFATLTGESINEDINKHILDQYAEGKNDETIVPAIFSKEGIIKKEDPILFFNFRADRMRQISRKFLDEGFDVFTLTEYEKNMTSNAIYKSESVKNTLADVLEKNNIEQVHIAETEKYAHVTYFFNGNVEKIHKNEIRKIIPSKKVSSFALMPEMSSKEITEEVMINIKNDKQFIVANYAAPDMVGHTGDYEATLKAIDFVDQQIGLIYDLCKQNNYILIITADHGNAEVMYDEHKNVINKKHTTNKVPLIITLTKNDINEDFDEREWGYENSDYSLADVAPTILDLFNLEIPIEFSGIKIEGVKNYKK